MAGLLAANLLRRMSPVVHEAQAALPQNHSALLRFRTDAVAKATGIPFRKVTVRKDISWRNETFCAGHLAVNNAYSHKVTGKISSRSILNTEAGERWIAPDNFVEQMASSVKIEFNSPLTELQVVGRNEESEPLISTLPMPVLMKMVEWKNQPKFDWKSIWSVRCTIQDCDVYQTIYYPERHAPYYRASITGDTLIVEYILEPDATNTTGHINSILKDFGINQKPEHFETTMQKYGKIFSVDPEACRRFILFMTDRYRIYSLGRFATWRNILLDSVVNDISVIEKLIDSRDGYQKTLHQQAK